MAWRDAVGNTSPHDLVRQLAVAPLADWSARAARLLTGQRQDLAYLLSTQTWLDAGSRCIRQPACDTHLIERYAAPADPASPPEPHRLNIHRDLLGNSRIAVPPLLPAVPPARAAPALGPSCGHTPGVRAHGAPRRSTQSPEASVQACSPPCFQDGPS